MVFWFFLPFYTCKWICWDTLGNRNYFKLTQLYKFFLNLPGLKFACWQGPKERKKNWWENFAVYSSVIQTIQTTMLRKSIIWHESGFHVITLLIPLRVFMWETAIRRMVSLSGLRASVLQVGTMSHNSLMYDVILFLLLLSISQWLSLWKKKEKNSSIYFFLLKKHNKEGINKLV